MVTSTYNNFTILQTNITSLKKNRDELERILNAKQITIACITETWLTDNDTQKNNLSNYNLINNNRDDGYGGTAIYI